MSDRIARQKTAQRVMEEVSGAAADFMDGIIPDLPSAIREIETRYGMRADEAGKLILFAPKIVH